MKHDRLLRVLFVFVWILALTHVAAEHYHLYWIYRWFDIPMHFFGGVWVTLAVVWFCFQSGYIQREKMLPVSAFVIAIGGGFLIGFVWKVYEFLVWQISGAGLPENYLPDSILDLIMDLLGAFVAYVGVALTHLISDCPTTSSTQKKPV